METQGLFTAPFASKADPLMWISLNLGHHSANVGPLAEMLAKCSFVVSRMFWSVILIYIYIESQTIHHCTSTMSRVATCNPSQETSLLPPTKGSTKSPPTKSPSKRRPHYIRARSTRVATTIVSLSKPRRLRRGGGGGALKKVPL